MSKHQIILASNSPRRRALLQNLGVNFDVDPEHVDEDVDGRLAPDEIVRELALRKGRPVSARHPDRLVLAADTIVVLDGRILGKPGSESEAREMLSDLSARTHRVYTGIALIHADSGREIADIAATDVTFSVLADDEIAEYVAGGSPLDKAGAYGIQDDRGCLFVERIDGDYYNVVGLPLNLLYHVSRAHFPELSIF